MHKLTQPIICIHVIDCVNTQVTMLCFVYFLSSFMIYNMKSFDI